jgi:hypothetical protein
MAIPAARMALGMIMVDRMSATVGARCAAAARAVSRVTVAIMG